MSRNAKAIAISVLALIGLAVWLSGLGSYSKRQAVAADEEDSDVYPFEVCIVTGVPIGSMGDPVIRHYSGREVRFCCIKCVGQFERNQAGYIEQIDAALIRQQLPRYPVDTCIGGGKLGNMGEPVNFVYRNRLIRFCCESCRDEFGLAPAKHLAWLNQAVIARDSHTYPLGKCVVTGAPLGRMGPPVQYVSGHRLLKFCCRRCIEEFKKWPARYLAELEGAIAARQPSPAEVGPAREAGETTGPAMP